MYLDFQERYLVWVRFLFPFVPSILGLYLVLFLFAYLFDFFLPRKLRRISEIKKQPPLPMVSTVFVCVRLAVLSFLAFLFLLVVLVHFFFWKKKECSGSLLICLRLFCLLTELTCRRLYLAHHFGSSMSGHVNLDFCSFSFYISLSLSFPLFLFFSLFVFVFFLGRPLISSRQDHLLGSIFFWNLVFVFFFGGCCCCCFLFSLFLFISLRPQCVNAAPYPQQIT